MSTARLPRCKKHTRRNKKTNECEYYMDENQKMTRKILLNEIKQIRKTPPILRQLAPLGRCKHGEKRNPKTQYCEPTNRPKITRKKRSANRINRFLKKNELAYVIHIYKVNDRPLNEYNNEFFQSGENIIHKMQRRITNEVKNTSGVKFTPLDVKTDISPNMGKSEYYPLYKKHFLKFGSQSITPVINPAHHNVIEEKRLESAPPIDMLLIIDKNIKVNEKKMEKIINTPKTINDADSKGIKYKIEYMVEPLYVD